MTTTKDLIRYAKIFRKEVNEKEVKNPPDHSLMFMCYFLFKSNLYFKSYVVLRFVLLVIFLWLLLGVYFARLRVSPSTDGGSNLTTDRVKNSMATKLEK